MYSSQLYWRRVCVPGLPRVTRNPAFFQPETRLEEFFENPTRHLLKYPIPENYFFYFSFISYIFLIYVYELFGVMVSAVVWSI
jgi:hypothetical protein